MPCLTSNAQGLEGPKNAKGNEMHIKKALVVIDDWKLEVFKKQLTDAGFAFTYQTGVVEATFELLVKYHDVYELSKVTVLANKLAEADKVHWTSALH